MVGPPCRRTRPPLFSARHSGMDMGKKGWAGGKKDSRLKDTGNGLAASGECQLYRTGTAPSNLAGGQAEIGIMYSHFSPFLEWKREKRGPLPPPAAFPRMGGAWGKNTFLTRRARKAPGKPGAHGEAEGGGVASGALRLPCDVAGDCGEGNALSGTPFPCISPVTSRARRASSPASHPASPAFGSFEASRPIEALGLRRDVLIFQ